MKIDARYRKENNKHIVLKTSHGVQKPIASCFKHLSLVVFLRVILNNQAVLKRKLLCTMDERP